MTQTTCDFAWANDRLTATLRGEIDHHSAKSVREEIDHAMYLYRPKILALDLSGISFMDSSGLGLILGRYTKQKALGGKLVLANPTPAIWKLLTLSGADKLCPIERGTQKGRE